MDAIVTYTLKPASWVINPSLQSVRTYLTSMHQLTNRICLA